MFVVVSNGVFGAHTVDVCHSTDMESLVHSLWMLVVVQRWSLQYAHSQLHNDDALLRKIRKLTWMYKLQTMSSLTG